MRIALWLAEPALKQVPTASHYTFLVALVLYTCMHMSVETIYHPVRLYARLLPRHHV